MTTNQPTNQLTSQIILWVLFCMTDFGLCIYHLFAPHLFYRLSNPVVYTLVFILYPFGVFSYNKINVFISLTTEPTLVNLLVCRYWFSQHYFVLLLIEGNPGGVMAKVQDCGCHITEFELKSCYYIHFWKREWTPHIPLLVLS